MTAKYFGKFTRETMDSMAKEVAQRVLASVLKQLYIEPPWSVVWTVQDSKAKKLTDS